MPVSTVARGSESAIATATMMAVIRSFPPSPQASGPPDERPVAFVVVRDGASVHGKDLTEFLRLYKEDDGFTRNARQALARLGSGATP